MNMAKRLCSRIMREDYPAKPLDLLRGWATTMAKFPKQYRVYLFPDASAVLVRRRNNRCTFYDIAEPDIDPTVPQQQVTELIQSCKFSPHEQKQAVRALIRANNQGTSAYGKYLMHLMISPIPEDGEFADLDLKQWEK